MPVRFGSRTVVSLYVSALLGSGQLRRLARIKTDRDHVKLFANIERHLSERTHHSIQDLIAKHRTRVINQRQHHGLAFEELTEPNVAALLIFENCIEWNSLVQSLIDADVLQCFW